ncbi:MAG: hypothetical protein LBR48_01960 [Dysgonamonadaceae bacterium]|jgi:hypothetical protein|nr:hypothetical protein [Dysgonamonadaceae bacterium]
MKKIALIFTAIFCLMGISLHAQNRRVLNKELLARYMQDQQVRKAYKQVSDQIKTSEDPVLILKKDSLYGTMCKVDESNQKFISSLLDSLNHWPKRLTSSANLALFFLIQHAGYDFMNKYTLLVDQAHQNKLLNPRQYAIYKDRLLMYNRKPQIYGTQTMNGYVWPIEDVYEVNSRRATVGFLPMESYVKSFERNGLDLIWDKELTVKQLMDLILVKEN